MITHPYCVDPSHWHVYPVPDFICVPGGGGYTVELGGETFTQGQWEAVQTYIDGPAPDAATHREPSEHTRQAKEQAR